MRVQLDILVHWNMKPALIKDVVVRQQLITDVLLMGCSARQTGVPSVGPPSLAGNPPVTRRLALISPGFTPPHSFASPSSPPSADDYIKVNQSRETNKTLSRLK